MTPLDGLLNISSEFDQNCKFIFFTFFFSFSFSLGVCGSYHKHEFLLQSLWMPWNLTCWRILTTSELIRFWSSSVDFSHFGIILTQWNRPNLQLLDIFWSTHGRNGLNFGMLMYPDHLQNLLNFFVHGLLIFLLLASFWLSETGHIWGLWQFSSECMGGMACNLTCWCILTTFSTAYILVIVYGFSSFWREFDFVKQVKFAVFRHFLEDA